MRELRQYAFVHFLASAMTQTSNIPKAITQSDLAMKALEERFPGGEDREVVDLRERLAESEGLVKDLENVRDGAKLEIERITGERDAAIAAAVEAAVAAEREAARAGSGT